MADEKKIIATNSKAKHDYFIEDIIECGIVLVGTEVKAVRTGKVNMKDSFALIRGSELFLHNMHISPYEQGNIYNKDPLRTRKLLAHKNEILRLIGLIKQKGITLVPLSIYFYKGHVKVELALAKGKKLFDKRDDIAKKDANRRILQHVDK
jgi:SsrA-binding protein